METSVLLKPVNWILLVYALLGIITVFYFDGTGDAGDSVLHYLYAKHVLQHPENLLNHWAKPFFTLLAFPFSQMGFTGIKLMNLIIVFFTLSITYKSTVLLGLRRAWVSLAVLILSPMYYALTFSGLTEPLFALVSVGSLYLVLRNNYLWAALLLSFLPFIRSEGLIIIGVFGFYFLLKKNWKFIPFLLTGHVVYSIGGYFYYHDLLWVFTKIPYAALESVYGKGRLLHFVDQLLHVVGVPVYVLFWTGFMACVVQFVRKKLSLEISILVVGSFTAFFVAHSLFWHFGIFNSLGLKRVLIGVLPFLAIIVLVGINSIQELLASRKKFVFNTILTIVMGLMIIFPFTKNHAALQVDRDLKLKPEQLCMQRIADYLKESGRDKRKMVYSIAYLSEILNIDHFDQESRMDLKKWVLESLEVGDIIIWDDWFAGFENGVDINELRKMQGIQHLYGTEANDRGRKLYFEVFEKVEY